MSDTPASLADIACAMSKPLNFAAKNNFANLAAVKGLDSVLPDLARRALALDCPEHIRDGMRSLAEDFEGFHGQPVEIQQALIIKSIELVNNIKNLSKIYDVKHNTPCTASISLKQLVRPVSELPGVGPKTAALLERLNVRTFEDLLFFVPRAYVDRRTVMPIDRIEPGVHAVVIGCVKGAPLVKAAGRMRMLELLVSDGSAVMTARWFKLPQRYAALLKNRYADGDRLMLTGQVKRFGCRLEMHHPEIEQLDPGEDPGALLSITPLYPLTEGLAQKTVLRITRALVQRIPGMVHEYLPAQIRTRFNLAGLQEAFTHVHLPATADNPQQLNAGTSRYHRRIVFDEFFMVQLMLALKKRGGALEQGIALALPDSALKALVDELPFELTAAQKRTIGEIRRDMASPTPMNRLLQGDVGSGKTVVSMLAACIAIHNGCQAAIMAPTEILAAQHHATISRLPAGRSLRITMLTGNQPRSGRARLLEDIRSGRTQLIIGTHALLQDAVEFHRLGLVIIDEQHKFGVLQRACFRNKGTRPDMLVMTATPIPRTLGLTVYGDLDISIIDQLPPGRQPVTTRLYGESRRADVYALVRTAIASGNQAFIVYPLVESSEKLDLLDATRMAAHLQQDIFPEYNIALLHGRMAPDEKEAVMRDFSDGRTHVLVATTVVEVGIDVPNAAIMVIEHAERFGLSQLHQLRGRVGRGRGESLCVLLAQFSRSDDARKRLSIMEQTSDGFRIAEEDFNIRGPGELLGTRQSGLPDFRVAHLGRDVRILQQARSAAFELIAEDPMLARPDHQALKKILAQRWMGRFELAGIG